MRSIDYPRNLGFSLPRITVAAWVVTLLASDLPNALWQSLFGAAPAWLVWAKLGLLLALAVAAGVVPLLRPLRPYFAVLAIFVLADWLVGWAVAGLPWKAWFGAAAWSVGTLAIRLLKVTAALVAVAALAAMRWKRQDYFLTQGQLDAEARPVRWLGMRRSTTWDSFGPIIAVVAAIGAAVPLLMTSRLAPAGLGQAGPLLALAVLFAALNALGEELGYRAPLLGTLKGPVGGSQALLLTAAVFGLAHYEGSGTAGLPWVALTALVGWLFGKSMLETRGLFWAWLMHFASDIPVFAVLALGSLAS